MLNKFKMWLDVFERITTGVMIATASFITIFWGSDTKIGVQVIWQALFVSVICTMGVLIFAEDQTKQVSKKGLFLQQIGYFLYVNFVVLGLGSYFEWFSFSNWKMVSLMELLILGIYIIVTAIGYLGDYTTAQNMNKQLEKLKKQKKQNMQHKED